MLWGGRNTEECLQCLGPTRFAPAHGVCAFPVYTTQTRGSSTGGPGLCALPRSKPLRFRFLGTPQKHRLGWAFVLCPSQIRAAQVARCLASTLSPGGRCVLSPPPSQPLSFTRVHHKSAVSSVPFFSSRKLISYCNPPGGCQPSRIPGRLG